MLRCLTIEICPVCRETSIVIFKDFVLTISASKAVCAISYIWTATLMCYV